MSDIVLGFSSPLAQDCQESAKTACIRVIVGCQSSPSSGSPSLLPRQQFTKKSDPKLRVEIAISSLALIS